MEVIELRNRFNFHLRRQFLIRPSVIQANYSLIERVNVLQHRSDNIIALVSSTTATAVQLKARSIGLMSEMLPIATSEDADTLPELLTILKARVKRSFGVQFDVAQLVGSPTWVTACENNDIELLDPIEFLAAEGCYSNIDFSQFVPHLA